MTAPAWAVRPARADDAPAIVALLAEVAREGRWIATEWPFDLAAYERNVRAALLERFMVAWVASAGPQVVGELSAHDLDGAEPQLGMLVAAAHRGRGIGRALIAAVSAWARARGTPALGLRVYPDNAAACALYRATGFVEVALEKDAIPRRDGSRLDVIRMRKPLTPPAAASGRRRA